ncbi:pyrimidine reductase family protein [Nakamurella endophytica]|uniref:Bacterial bifunctional deaminase-reductase C-terminal domain-containing protein n=1 Tax=Nakamurella endophytica TaxID=1748367 RepID=A0A917TC59_9ACTN|nr:pyrimidine reductase family protein [Nakamurella endophytica]GGM16961.1 hypothetical protein GCM10011594_41270 [Nakamurella endophytica]
MERLFSGYHADPDDDELARSYPWPAGRWLRANMIVSLDGRTAVAGRSGALGDDADRRLFQLLRDTADVVLVGAATVRAEGYGGSGDTPESRARRARWGLGDPPPVAVVTRGGLDPDLPLFTRTSVPPIVLTTAAGAARLSGVPATVLAVGDDRDGDVDLSRALDALAARGLRHVGCEGGPALLGRLVRANLVDELCLTTAPVVAGGPATELLGGQDGVAGDWRLATLHRSGGHLFTRYLRART